MDPDVSDSDKDKIKQIIQEKIDEEKALKKAEKMKQKTQTSDDLEEPSISEQTLNGAEVPSRSNLDFSRPPPIFSQQSAAPHVVTASMDVPSSSAAVQSQHPMTAQSVTPMASHIVPVAAPVPVPTPFTIPPPVPPPPPTATSTQSQQPQFLEGLGMTDNEIVADAIRRGMVAPIPQELLMGSGPGHIRDRSQPALTASVLTGSSLEADMRKLMEMNRRIQMEKRFAQDMDEVEERRNIRRGGYRPPPPFHNGTDMMERDMERRDHSMMRPRPNHPLLQMDTGNFFSLVRNFMISNSPFMNNSNKLCDLQLLLKTDLIHHNLPNPVLLHRRIALKSEIIGEEIVGTQMNTSKPIMRIRIVSQRVEVLPHHRLRHLHLHLLHLMILRRFHLLHLHRRR